MEGTNEKILEALKLLLQARVETTDEVLKNATKEELEQYIAVTEEVEAKLEALIENYDK